MILVWELAAVLVVLVVLVAVSLSFIVFIHSLFKNLLSRSFLQKYVLKIWVEVESSIV